MMHVAFLQLTNKEIRDWYAEKWMPKWNKAERKGSQSCKSWAPAAKAGRNEWIVTKKVLDIKIYIRFISWLFLILVEFFVKYIVFSDCQVFSRNSKVIQISLDFFGSFLD